MFVIMDMEWILSYNRVPCPTQLAAVRVNRLWQQFVLNFEEGNLSTWKNKHYIPNR